MIAALMGLRSVTAVDLSIIFPKRSVITSYREPSDTNATGAEDARGILRMC
jgi:hypothetical protein